MRGSAPSGIKRGNNYSGIILDPPAYGHGPDGERWKLDDCLFELLQNVAQILEPKDSFMVLNLYSNGYSALLGETVVKEAFKLKGSGYTLESGRSLPKRSRRASSPLSSVYPVPLSLNASRTTVSPRRAL